MNRLHSLHISRLLRAQERLSLALLLCGLVCIGMMVLILSYGEASWGILYVFAPFLVSGLLVTFVLARRTLTTSELKLAARFFHSWLALFTAWNGVLFWAGYYSSYYTSLLLPPSDNSGCCIGYPALPAGIVLIPWLMLTAGSITAIIIVLRSSIARLFEVVSSSLLFTMILTPFTWRPFYLTNGYYSYFAGLPLAWFAQSFSTCAFCSFYGGIVLVAPFLLDWVFWGILTGGIIHILRFRHKKLLVG